MINLLLADDQKTYRQGLAELLSLEPDLTVVAQADNGERAVALTQQHQPDVILMDVRMPICNGVEATRIIHQRYPWIRILVLSTFDEDEYIWQSLQHGALSDHAKLITNLSPYPTSISSTVSLRHCQL